MNSTNIISMIYYYTIKLLSYKITTVELNIFLNKLIQFYPNIPKISNN